MFELGILTFLIFGTQIHVVGQSAPPALPLATPLVVYTPVLFHHLPVDIHDLSIINLTVPCARKIKIK